MQFQKATGSLSFLYLLYSGFTQGLGFEISFFILWLLWKITHGKIAHRLHTEHWFHKISEYFE